MLEGLVKQGGFLVTQAFFAGLQRLCSKVFFACSVWGFFLKL